MRAFGLLTALAACAACSPSWDTCGDAFCLDVETPQLASGVGAAQGLDVRDGRVWIIGDADTGVARAFTLDAAGKLTATGAAIDLTVDGEDRAPHPTGLTYQPEVGTFLGDTVHQRGEILMLDWEAATAGGTLDGAIVHAVPDGAAHNGSRPELVRVDGRWLVATADYGDRENELRLYDPDYLLGADDTSDANVVVARIPSPPYVQALHYWQTRDILVMVQNRHSGSGWKLTLVDLPASVHSGALVVLDVLEPGVPGELEGFHFIGDERALMVTSGGSRNAFLVTLTARA